MFHIKIIKYLVIAIVLESKSNKKMWSNDPVLYQSYKWYIVLLKYYRKHILLQKGLQHFYLTWTVPFHWINFFSISNIFYSTSYKNMILGIPVRKEENILSTNLWQLEIVIIFYGVL